MRSEGSQLHWREPSGRGGSTIRADSSVPPSRLRFWALYWASWALLGLALALADYQRVLRGDGRKAWEPFVLELTSVLAIAVLALAIYRWLHFLERTGWDLPRQALGHAAAALTFCVAHVALMYALRFALYAAVGDHYATGTVPRIFAYEFPKDLVTYVLVAGLAFAVRLRQREQAHRIEIEQARRALAELQLTRLSDQLHPHFLFNALNSVAALVEENPRVAIAMIARIGDFLRAALEGAGHQTATLSEELALVRAYLAIQAIRFEGAIDVVIAEAPGTGGTRVPRLLLQPIVENAVKHSMVRPATPLSIRIATAAAGEGLSIRIANSRSPGVQGSATGGTGKGLDIVRNRLALHYGSAARLAIAEDDAAWYVVTLVLPAGAPLPVAGEAE